MIEIKLKLQLKRIDDYRRDIDITSINTKVLLLDFEEGEGGCEYRYSIYILHSYPHPHPGGHFLHPSDTYRTSDERTPHPQYKPQ